MSNTAVLGQVGLAYGPTCLALVEELAPGGRLVIPVGSAEQELKLMVKTAAGLETRSVVPVRFVPMVGGP